nr:hydantoinase/oxoprolinase family protein [uncultured Oscillibacter sp.]
MKLAIGIDTGGTCTDAVLYDFDSGQILSHNKALTTHDDLTRGILAALDGLDIVLCRQASVAGLSTTLATNACVEGKIRRTRLLLMGIDRRGIERFGADYGFTDPDDIRYLPCRTTITGQILEEPDWDFLRTHAKEWFSGVEGCAVCEIYGMRNGGVLEQTAARIVEAETGLPVVCASALFGGLSSLERAASAVLNAGLLPVTREFLDAVRKAFQTRGIGAEIFIVRSDSSLMGLQYSAEHAVETLLSGPAASALGGSALTGQQNAVIVDMGGTTTDVALIEAGVPLLSEDGIRVGKWKTLVSGLSSASFALGGDSAVRWDNQGVLSLGPDRMIPLCVLAEAHPGIVPVLRAQVRDVPAHSIPLHEFLTLNRTDWAGLELSESDRRLCRALEAGPLSVQQAADAAGVDKYQLRTGALEQAGVLLRAGLTPTDVMHVKGDYTRYNRDASILAVRFAAASVHMEPEAFCGAVYECISREIFCAVSQMLLEHASPYYHAHGLDAGMRELLRLQWKNRMPGGSSMLHYCFRSPAALVGIGGPTHLFLPAAAQALDAVCVIPDCASVANAVGAVTGQMTDSVSAEVRPHGLSPEDSQQMDYEVLCAGQPPHYFRKEEDAIAWASGRLHELTSSRLRARGATGALSFQVKQQELLGRGIKLATRVEVTAGTCLIQTASEGGSPCLK